MIGSAANALGHRQPAVAGFQRQAFVRRAPFAVARSAASPRQVNQPWTARIFGTQLDSLLPAATFGLKLVASALAGAALTLLLWNDDPSPSVSHSLPRDGVATPFYPDHGQSVVPSNIRRPGRTPFAELPQPDREPPSNFPLRIRTVSFTPPGYLSGSLPSASPPSASSSANPLSGKALRYLIGTESSGSGRDDEVIELSYSATQPAKHGISIAYCNLFDERNTGRYGPYLHSSDTAAQYNEGQIDPRGPGWEKNLREQFERRKRQGFAYIELDNPDAYAIKDVIGAIDLAATYGLKVIAKNPLLMEGGTSAATAYVAHPNVHGIIVEKGAGNPGGLDTLRRRVGKPSLPVWFVAFGSGRSWADSVADAAKRYRNMGVTYSSAGEYGNAIDILPPA